MVWRYILAFVLSIIVLIVWLPRQPAPEKEKPDPVVGEEAGEKAGGAKPVVGKPAVGEPAVGKEAGEKEGGEKPVVGKPVVDKPVKLVKVELGNIRLWVDPSGGSISSVILREHFTKVQEEKEEKEEEEEEEKDEKGKGKYQTLFLQSASGPTLLSIQPEGDLDADWAMKQEELEDGRKQIVFEKEIKTTHGKVRIRKTLSPAKADEFDELLGEGVCAKADGSKANGSLLRLSITFELEKRGEANGPIDYDFRLYGPCGISSTSTRSPDIQLAYGTYEEKGFSSSIKYPDDKHLPGGDDDGVGDAWLATVNSYFAALMFPRSREEGVTGIFADPEVYPRGAWMAKYPEGPPEGEEPQTLRTGIKFTSRLVPGKPREHVFGLYLGPRVSDFIEAEKALDFSEANNFGVTSGLIHFFMGVLSLLHTITLGNWGLAIILLTVLVKLCLHPITRKNQRGMMRMGKVMGKIKPEMDALQEKYGEDRMKYSQEVQKLWKKHDVNPGKQMLGCLVIFLQMPIWIGIIWSLDYSIGLRQADFLWIQDLTEPDMLDRGIMRGIVGDRDYTSLGFLNFWPIYAHVNLLPVLYVVLTLVNQKMQPRSKDPQAATQQKMMGYMMIFFGVIFYTFAAGFMLYIMTSAALGIAESKIIKAQLAREDLETGGDGADAVLAAPGPLYTKKKSPEKSVVPSSEKKKKRRR